MKRNKIHISQILIIVLMVLVIGACSDDDAIQEPEVKNRIDAIGLGSEG
ncbi:MAG: hypothetical protein HKN90_02860, partial [Flavobacteriaceae bacterium]|nr:hypothetical protein [Flavobacteriaceae bacterium]